MKVSITNVRHTVTRLFLNFQPQMLKMNYIHKVQTTFKLPSYAKTINVLLQRSLTILFLFLICINMSFSTLFSVPKLQSAIRAATWEKCLMGKTKTGKQFVVTENLHRVCGCKRALTLYLKNQPSGLVVYSLYEKNKRDEGTQHGIVFLREVLKVEHLYQ